MPTPYVSSFNTRTGAVVSATNDYSFSQISGIAASSQLPVFGTSAAGIVPASGGGTANFMRADGTWAIPTNTTARNFVWADMGGTSYTGVGNNATVVVPFNHKVSDSDGVFNTSNYRYTPNISGKFLIAGAVLITTDLSTTLYEGASIIYMNGSPHFTGSDVEGHSAPNFDAIVSPYSAIVTANGSTDYFQIFAYLSNYSLASVNVVSGDQTKTYFTACWLGP